MSVVQQGTVATRNNYVDRVTVGQAVPAASPIFQWFDRDAIGLPQIVAGNSAAFMAALGAGNDGPKRMQFQYYTATASSPAATVQVTTPTWWLPTLIPNPLKGAGSPLTETVGLDFSAIAISMALNGGQTVAPDQNTGGLWVVTAFSGSTATFVNARSTIG